MRLVQIGERNLLTTAIEEGLKSSGVEVFTYPPGPDAFFFAHDLQAQILLLHRLSYEQFHGAIEKYPDLAKKIWALVSSQEDFKKAQGICPQLHHLPLPVAPLKLKKILEEWAGG